jgi:hypothetical protein
MGLEATTLVWWMGGPKKSSGKKDKMKDLFK